MSHIFLRYLYRGLGGTLICSYKPACIECIVFHVITSTARQLLFAFDLMPRNWSRTPNYTSIMIFSFSRTKICVRHTLLKVIEKRAKYGQTIQVDRYANCVLEVDGCANHTVQGKKINSKGDGHYTFELLPSTLYVCSKFVIEIFLN